MNTKLKMSLMLVALAGLVLAAGFAFTGCATVTQQVRGSVAVSGLRPKLVVTGPARGHWAEESEHPVVAYKVRGTNCSQLAAQVGENQIEDHGVFMLAPNESLCAFPLRRDQRILFHGERPRSREYFSPFQGPRP